MPSSLRLLFWAALFLFSISTLHAQSSDYLKHRKVFDICAIHMQCSECYTCEQQRLTVKIKNSQEHRVTAVFYKFYSSVFNQIIEKEAKIQGNKIDVHQTGLLYVCVPDKRHWIISKITYDDESSQTFILHDRMENFLQEPDECDCND